MPTRHTAASLLVRDDDEAIEFSTRALPCRLLEDKSMGGGKCWVVVAPVGSGGASLLLVKAADKEQAAHVEIGSGFPDLYGRKNGILSNPPERIGNMLRSSSPRTWLMILALALLNTVVFVMPISWAYTNIQLWIARREGVYPTALDGMRIRLEQSYTGIDDLQIVLAGTNSFDGSAPHIWYVIAEIRAAARADGSELGKNGCDAPGSFYLQTQEGWVHVPEGALPELIGFWMKVYGLAGPGQVEPAVEWATTRPSRLCLAR